MMATVTLRQEATDLLQRLIRLDTVNPPGNETLAAELLRDYLAESGVAKWTFDTIRMTMTYYDQAGNEMLAEEVK